MRRQAPSIVFDHRNRAFPAFWVPLIAGVNVLVFLAFGFQGNGWVSADSVALVRWGSNDGPHTLGGEPWRLASAMFLHGGAIHLIVNMITLMDLGRICERFFGRSRFLVLYMLSGVVGSVASVWWNPAVNSVGASGAICGILGAMLMFMLDSRNRVPVEMLKSHAAGIGIFLVYSAIMGAGNAPIDHAAHAGGLVAGAMCAVYLSPWWRTSQALAGSAIMVLAIAGLVRFAPGESPQVLEARLAQQRFNEDTLWFGNREKELLAIAGQRVPQWMRVENKPLLRDLGVQWNEIHARFTAYKFEPSSRQGQLQRLLLDYTDQRSRSYRALADLPPKEAREEFERLSAEMKKTVDAINALSPTR